MKDIVKKYIAWKKGNDEGYIYDEIHEFFAALTRGELLEIMEYLEKKGL